MTSFRRIAAFLFFTPFTSGVGSAAESLLPSQEAPGFYNVRICGDRQVLSVIKTAADYILKAKVRIAHGSPEGPGWDPNDLQLEAVNIGLKDYATVICSMSIEAKGISERIVYSIMSTPNGDSWRVKFGGDFGPRHGGHILFPEQIEVGPTGLSQ